MTRARTVVAQVVAGLWFRTLRLEGPSLPEGALLLVLNHPNGLLDPVVVSALVDPSPRFLAKSTLWNMALLRPFLALFDAIPVERAQDIGDPESRARATSKAFAAVHGAFNHGHRVGLYPEGISHGNAQLAPLKTGAARMALSSPVKPILVPAGLVYGQRDLFRHNVLLRLGEPIEYGDLQGQGDDPAAVLELTARIRLALLPLTLHGAEAESLRLAKDLAWLLAEGPQERMDLEAHRVRVRSLLKALEAWDPADLKALRARVDEAHTWLDENGVRPDQVGHPYAAAEVRAWIPKALLHHIAALVIAPAAFAFWPPYRFNGWLTNRLTNEVDVVGTTKLLGGALFLPLWTALLMGLGAWWWGWKGPALVILMALLAFLSLPLSERLMEDWQALRGFLLRNHLEVPRLVEARAELLRAFPQLQT